VCIVSVFAGIRWINRQVEQKLESSTHQVAVANINVAPGTRLSSEMVTAVQWPANVNVEGAVADPKVLVNRITLNGLSKNEPILEKNLAPQGSKAGLSALITPGMRAITVKVNEIAGVAGFTLPGSYVDLVLNIQENQTQIISKILYQHILVLAVAQDAVSTDATKPKIVNSVTLETTPAQAEKIDLARSVGSLTLLLRNDTDQIPVITNGVNKSEILNISRLEAPLVKPSSSARSSSARSSAHYKPETVEVFRGSARSLMTIQYSVLSS